MSAEEPATLRKTTMAGMTTDVDGCPYPKLHPIKTLELIITSQMLAINQILLPGLTIPHQKWFVISDRV